MISALYYNEECNYITLHLLRDRDPPSENLFNPIRPTLVLRQKHVVTWQHCEHVTSRDFMH